MLFKFKTVTLYFFNGDKSEVELLKLLKSEVCVEQVSISISLGSEYIPWFPFLSDDLSDSLTTSTENDKY